MSLRILCKKNYTRPLKILLPLQYWKNEVFFNVLQQLYFKFNVEHIVLE